MSDTWPRNAAGDEALIGDDPAAAPVDIEEAPPPSDADLARVRTLALEQVSLLRKKVTLENDLEAVNVALKLNMEKDLPDVLAQLGMTDFGLANGHRVELKETVNASIPKDPVITAQAHDWLEAARHFIVKRRITIEFGRDEVAWARRFMADCARRKVPLHLEEKKWVEPQTLGALVRELLSRAKAESLDPEDLAPSQLLGVFRLTRAEVSGPNVPKPRKKKS